MTDVLGHLSLSRNSLGTLDLELPEGTRNFGLTKKRSRRLTSDRQQTTSLLCKHLLVSCHRLSHVSSFMTLMKADTLD